MKLRVKKHLDYTDRTIDGKIISRTYYYTIEIRQWFFWWRGLNFRFIDGNGKLLAPTPVIHFARELRIGVEISPYEGWHFDSKEDAEFVMALIYSDPSRFVQIYIPRGYCSGPF